VLAPGRATLDRSHQQIYAIALAAGIVASVFGWLVGELTRTAFKPREIVFVFQSIRSVGPSNETLNTADYKNAVLAFGIMGGVTGLLVGFAGGLGARSPFRGAIVGLGGFASGGLVATVASITILPFLYRRLVPDPNDLLTPIMVYGGISAAIGAVGGAAFAIGMGRGRLAARAMAGACLGAFLGTVVFQLLNELVFAHPSSGSLVSGSSSTRLLTRLLVTVLTALGAAWGSVGGLARPTISPPSEIP